MKILVTGATGQVGFELVRSLSLFGDLLTPAREELDLSDAHAVALYLDKHQPQLVANAAAYTAVDKAESEPALADRLNHLLPKQLAEYCLDNRAALIHFSSDYVYSGESDTPYTEESVTGPLSEYGRTKWAGDRAVIGSSCNHIILRTSWVYSARGNNFMKTMLRLAQEKDGLRVVADQVGCPTPARLIAQVTCLCVRPLVQHDLHGVYNLSAAGETSWFEFAKTIFKQAKLSGQQLKLTSLEAISSQDYVTAAKRPLNSRLNTAKLSADLNITLPDWQVALKQTLAEYLDA